MKDTQKREAEAVVVGVGASAGGLDALARFFAAMEMDIRASFIVVQHLDPTQKSQLSDLLGRRTTLKVREGRHAEPIRPGTVYTTPPGKHVTVIDGHIMHEAPTEARHSRAPIDRLFRSLAENYGARAIGVVLSGTGSDGRIGLQAIRESGGATYVQAPSDAEFDGMPRAAIESGAADVVASAEDLANRMRERLGLTMRLPAAGEFRSDGLAELLEILLVSEGYDFFEYKPATLDRRVKRRMAQCNLRDVGDYIGLLRETPAERDALIRDLLIGVTSFFRDPEAWEALAELAIDPIIRKMAPGDTFRAWTVGCASGEETYTLAMTLLERVERLGAQIRLQVFGTDLNPAAIDIARSGAYQIASVAGLSASRIERWFDRDGDQIRVIPDLREKVVFATQNTVNDPPFSALNLITCRNLLIYLDVHAQDRLMDLFDFSLSPDGFLMLGAAESAVRAASAFAAVSAKHRIYQRAGGRSRLASPRALPRRDLAVRLPPKEAQPSIVADAATMAMLSRFVPPAVLLRENFEIVGLHGELGDYIQFRRGNLTSSFLNMVADPYQVQVWKVVQSARRDNAPAETIANPVEPGQARTRILAEPVRTDGRSEYLVYFIREESGPPAAADPGHSPVSGPVSGVPVGVPDRNRPDDVVGSYRNEVAMLRDELQAVIERSEKSNEALQAANEEVMSANEELQSSNEELETSREELQSLNQELKSINSELEDKVSELEATNDDLANLIRSTNIATIFLDKDLTIRRFSAGAQDLLSIREEDIGRPLGELAFKVTDPTLLRDVRAVLSDLERRDVEVAGIARSYLRQVTPYKTRTDMIQGAIITYADVTSLSVAARKLSQQAQRQLLVSELGEFALGSQDVSALFERTALGLGSGLGAMLAAVQRHDSESDSFRLIAGAGKAARLVGTRTANLRRNELGLVFRKHGALVTPDIGRETRFSASPLLADCGARAGVCVTIGPELAPWGVVEVWWAEAGAPDNDVIQHITSVAHVLSLAISRAEARSLRENEREVLQSLIDGLPIMFGVVDEQMRFELFNRAFEEIGWIPEEMKGAPVAEVLGSDAARAARAIMRAAGTESLLPREIQLRYPDNRLRTQLLYCVPRLERDKARGAYLAVLDIHERKMWEERNRVISTELDHRVKNILALVSTIARMTGRYSTDYENFQKVLADRIDSLARTHARLAAKSWAGMDLETLVGDELSAYAMPETSQYVLAGPEVSIGMGATQSLSMVFHELTTNAVKYGALARPGGQLDVSWRLDEIALVIRWREFGFGAVATPRHTGFGSTVIQNAIKRQLGGAVERHFGEEGMLCVLTIPRRNLVEGGSGDGWRENGSN